MSSQTFGTELKRVLAIGFALTVCGCGLDGIFGNDGGRVRVVLSPEVGSAIANVVPDTTGVLLDDDDDDDDGKKGNRGAWSFRTANVTLSSIFVRTLDGELIELDSDLPVTVDLVHIDGGRHVELPDGFLPPGTYDEVVFVITAVQGVAHDGTVITIEPPGGGWTTVVPMCAFDVLDGETDTIGIALNVRSSFLRLGNWWSFQPRFRSLNDCDD
jgi:hypothetical protein